jgi:hypothetical protein
VTAFALFIGPPEAGPCENDVYRANLALGKRLNATASAGKIDLREVAPPTDAGDGRGRRSGARRSSASRLAAATEDLEKARKADSEGNLAACRAALADMDRQLAR